MLPSLRKFPHSFPCQSSPSHRRKPLLSSITIDYFNLYLYFLKTESFTITLSYLIFLQIITAMWLIHAVLDISSLLFLLYGILLYEYTTIYLPPTLH